MDGFSSDCKKAALLHGGWRHKWTTWCHDNVNTPPLSLNSVSHHFVNFFCRCFFLYKNSTFFHGLCYMHIQTHQSLSHSLTSPSAALRKPHAHTVSEIKCMGIRTRRPCTVLLRAYTHAGLLKKMQHTRVHTLTETISDSTHKLLKDVDVANVISHAELCLFKPWIRAKTITISFMIDEMSASLAYHLLIYGLHCMTVMNCH